MIVVLGNFYLLSTVTPKDIGCFTYIFYNMERWQLIFIMIFFFIITHILYLVMVFYKYRQKN